MKRWVAVLLCLSALLFCACGERAAAPVTAESATTEVVAITEAPTTTEATTTRVLQPLPEGCRLVEYAEIKERLEEAKGERDPDVNKFLKNRTQSTRWSDDGRKQLVLRDNTSGEEIVLTSPYEDEPYVKYIIDGRYIVWTTYYRANNNFHGIYDIKRDRYIEVEAGGYIQGMNGGYLYAVPKNQDETLRVYRIPLDGLDKKDCLKYDVNLLKGLPEASLREHSYFYTYSDNLSPDCRYFAVQVEEGVLVFDLHVPKLVLRVPSEAIPEGLYGKCFFNNKTVYYYNENEPLALKITLP